MSSASSRKGKAHVHNLNYNYHTWKNSFWQIGHVYSVKVDSEFRGMMRTRFVIASYPDFGDAVHSEIPARGASSS